jgi:hypothetical protein
MRKKITLRQVRWNTQHVQADSDAMFAALGDDFAIALDRNGWTIRMKDVCRESARTVDECEKWPMRAPSDACPTWATEMAVVTKEPRRIGYEPYPPPADCPQ